MTYELQTLERALQLLSTLAVDYPLRLSDLTERLETNQTTVLRTLRVLERHGYVRRAGNGLEYQLGTRLAELGLAATSSIDVSSAIRPWTTALSRQFAATAHLGMLRTNMVTVIAKTDAPESRVQYSSLGSRLPLHATAAGKAALALLALPGPELELLVAPLEACTSNSIRSLPALQADLDGIVGRRFSVEREEYQIGFGCVGSAFRIRDDVYTVSISGSIVSPKELDDRGYRLRDAMDEFLHQYAGAIQGLVQPPVAGNSG